MAGDPSSGLAAAVDEATEDLVEPAPANRQLPLFSSDRLAELPGERLAREAMLRAARSGPGRPAGALNKRTIEWRDFLLARGTSPLVVLQETYLRSVHDLAAELKCKTMEAFKIQVLAAAELAPYVHSKMPVEVKIEGALPRVYLVDPKAWLALHGATVVEGEAVDLSKVTIVSDQEVIEAEDEGLGRPDLEGAEKGQADQQLKPVEPLISGQPVEAGDDDQAEPGSERA